MAKAAVLSGKRATQAPFGKHRGSGDGMSAKEQEVNTGNPIRREERSQPEIREGQAGLNRVAERSVANKEQRTLCNGGTCMTKANSWRATTPAYRQAPLKLLLALHAEQKTKPKKTLCVEVERNKMPDPEEDQAGPSAQSPRSNR
jgi:hypothetical protein